LRDILLYSWTLKKFIRWEHILILVFFLQKKLFFLIFVKCIPWESPFILLRYDPHPLFNHFIGKKANKMVKKGVGVNGFPTLMKKCTQKLNEFISFASVNLKTNQEATWKKGFPRFVIFFFEHYIQGNPLKSCTPLKKEYPCNFITDKKTIESRGYFLTVS